MSALTLLIVRNTARGCLADDMRHSSYRVQCGDHSKDVRDL
jgi:hypothetical protein